MILTQTEILKAFRDKRIVITPKPKEIGPASVDLTLDKFFRLLKPAKEPVSLKEGVDYKKYTVSFMTEKYFDLKPGQACFRLANPICRRFRNKFGMTQVRK